MLAAGLVALPNFIDWTEYRTSFAARLSAAAGRPVSIDGSVDFVLLPRPAFNADEVRFAGRIPDDYVAVRRLSARLAFLPLLQGRMQFRELVLRRPEARITRGSQGKVDFLLFEPSPQPGRAASASETPDPFDLNIARIEIEDGSILFQDVANGTSVGAEGVDLTVNARPGAPVSISGGFVIDNTLMGVEAAIGRGVPGSKTVNLTLNLPEADATAQFSGTIAGDDAWTLRGDLDVSGTGSAAVLGAFGAVGLNTRLPEALRKPFSLSAKINGTPQSISADPLTFDIGGTTAKGSVTWEAQAPPKMAVKIEFGAVKLETWKFAAAMPPSSSFGLFPSARAQEAPPDSNALYAPFKNLSATFDIRFPSLLYQGQILESGFVEASLVNGQFTLSNVSFELPAATRLKAFGLARFGDAPSFDGGIEMQTADLRGLLSWAGVAADPGHLLQDRLKNASLRAALQGTPTSVLLSDLQATVDTSNLTGRVFWETKGRDKLALDLGINALNLDAYMPMFTAAVPASAAASVAPAAAAGPSEAKPSPYGVTAPPLHALRDIDLDIHVLVDSLTAGGVSGGKAGVDLQLVDGLLNVRSASFEDIAGVTAWFGGQVRDVAFAPIFDNVQFDISAADLVRAGRTFNFALPEVLESLKPLSLTGVVGGSMAQATIAATLKAADLTVRADGEGLTLDRQPQLALNIEATQGSTAALVRSLGRIWPVALADPGALRITAKVTDDASKTNIEAIDFRAGDNTFTGNLSIAKGSGGSDITGTLADMKLSLDRLWPKQPARVFAAPVSRVPARGAPAAKSAWSDEAFDWSFLQGWRGNVQVSGPAFAWRGMQVQDFSARVNVADGAAEIADWNGKIFGAPGQLYVKAAATPAPSIQGEIAFIGGNLAAASNAINGGAGGMKSGGKIDFAGSFRAQGANPLQLVSDLSGSGTIKLTATETGTGAVAGLLGAVAAANQVEGLSGGRAGAVTMESRFSAATGRIQIEDATVASKSYGGAFSGSIDLARWQVDLRGRLRLEAAGQPAARLTDVPIAVKGALDLPNITLLPR